MKSVNLIPAPRQAAKRRWLHLRRCAAGCAAWAALSVAAAGVTRAMWADAGDGQAEERLAAVNEDIQRTERAMAEVRNQLAAAQSTLRANESIANQPDWSVLLAVLGQKVGADVVLKGCRVHPAGGAALGRSDPRRTTVMVQPAPGAAAGGGETPFVLQASGMAKSHAAANRFVLELERTGLFAKVTLLDTTREAFFVGEAIAFQLECSLDDPATAAAGSPAAGGTAAGGASGTSRRAARASTDAR